MNDRDDRESVNVSADTDTRYLRTMFIMFLSGVNGNVKNVIAVFKTIHSPSAVIVLWYFVHY